MRRWAVGVVVATVAAAGVAAGAPAVGAVDPPALSEACQALNDPFYDAVHSLPTGFIDGHFALGEEVVVTATAVPLSDAERFYLFAPRTTEPRIELLPGTIRHTITNASALGAQFGAIDADNHNATASFEVGCGYAPVVITQPVSTSVEVGATASFTATASETPTPTVQWQRSDDGVTYTDIPGATSGTFQLVATTDDAGDRFRAVFTNPIGTATSDPATLTVTQPPPPPTSSGYSVADVTIVEGNGGVNTPKIARFTVTRTGDLSTAGSVAVHTESGTSGARAIQDTDFKKRDTILQFPAGVSSVVLEVKIIGDLIDEPDERFRVVIEKPVGGTVTDHLGIGTIVDDD